MNMATAEIFPKRDFSPLIRQMNRAMFVSWVNADLLNRHQNDVDKSIMLFDADKDFAFATRVEMDEEMWDMLLTSTSIRYWSQGL